MPQFHLPYFGALDSDNLSSDYFDTEILIAGVKCELNLRFDELKTDISHMQAVQKYLENLETHCSQMHGFIRDSYQDKNASDGTGFYLQFHKEELGEELLRKVLGVTGEGQEPSPVTPSTLRNNSSPNSSL